MPFCFSAARRYSDGGDDRVPLSPHSQNNCSFSPAQDSGNRGPTQSSVVLEFHMPCGSPPTTWAHATLAESVVIAQIFDLLGCRLACPSRWVDQATPSTRSVVLIRCYSHYSSNFGVFSPAAAHCQRENRSCSPGSDSNHASLKVTASATLGPGSRQMHPAIPTDVELSDVRASNLSPDALMSHRAMLEW